MFWLSGKSGLQQLRKVMLDLLGLFRAGWAAQFTNTPFIQDTAVGDVFEIMQVRQLLRLTKAAENRLPEALIVYFSTRHQGSVQVEYKDLCAAVYPFP